MFFGIVSSILALPLAVVLLIVGMVTATITVTYLPISIMAVVLAKVGEGEYDSIGAGISGHIADTLNGLVSLARSFGFKK